MVDHVRTPKELQFAVAVPTTQICGLYVFRQNIFEHFNNEKSAVDFAISKNINEIYSRSLVADTPEDGGSYEWRNTYDLLYKFHDGEWYGVDWKGDRDKNPTVIE